jgi:hypothetical protein
MKLKITQRKDHDGVDCVAPFIDDWNVWDIPKKQWSQAVEQAIKHAYELGYRAANSAHSRIENVGSADWE